MWRAKVSGSRPGGRQGCDVTLGSRGTIDTGPGRTGHSGGSSHTTVLAPPSPREVPLTLRDYCRRHLRGFYVLFSLVYTSNVLWLNIKRNKRCHFNKIFGWKFLSLTSYVPGTTQDTSRSDRGRLGTFDTVDTGSRSSRGRKGRRQCFVSPLSRVPLARSPPWDPVKTVGKLDVTGTLPEIWYSEKKLMVPP